jgi:tetratricopeptide (TPR) repeat protein
MSMSTTKSSPPPSGARQSAARGRSRRFGWLAGLPAALVGGLSLAVGWAAASTTPDQIHSMYTDRAQRATQSRDYRVAKLCFERLALAPDSTAETQFRLAETLEALEDRRRAAAILTRLAPDVDDRPGYAPAQLRLAQILLSENPTPPPVINEARRHLRRALKGDPTSVEANSLLAQILIATGHSADATPFLHRAVTDRPELRIVLARVYREVGQPDSARHEANLAIREFKSRAVANPDDPEAHVRWAEAHAFLEEYSDAADALKQGWQRTNDPRYRPTIASLYAVWAANLKDDPKAEPGFRLSLLEKGLRWDPTSNDLLDQFNRMLQTGGAEAERARAMLRNLLAKGENRAGVHFVLGVDAWLRARPDEARLHLEQAERLDPQSPFIVNNLAWLLVHAKPPDPQRALTLVNLALERQPANPAFRGTRGVVLARLERWKEALPDLEAALTATPRDAELHQALADAYEHLGLTEMAAAHRKQLADLGKPQG